MGRIKLIVAASASRKRAAFRRRSRASAEVSFDVLPGEQDSSHQIPKPPNPTYEQSPIRNEPYVAKPKPIDKNEANLMMHYLDNVFYVQFRFHRPAISAGGRGWLLSLLNCTKPLYHAALSLSAFHQQSLLWRRREDQAQIDYLHTLERHHNLTLKELQLFIHAHSDVHITHGAFSSNVQILACMVQLISFEVRLFLL